MMIQQAKLTRDANDPALTFGQIVSLSAHGDVALVGASDGTWVFSRRFGNWGEDAKLPHAGGGMALASNARTAFIGNSSRISVVRYNGGVWAEDAPLYCSDATDPYSTSTTFALTHDRSTLLVGAPSNKPEGGAAWVFVRNEQGVWSEQTKLTGFEEKGVGNFGWSVALSDDGNTALIGGNSDDNQRGAAWTFTRDGSRWHPLTKLSLPQGTRDQQFGYSVALSADGHRALISDISGVRTYLLNLGVWQQDGDKLLLTSATSVALSADGMTALIGDPGADGGVGAAWLWLLAGALYKVTASDELGIGYFGYQVALAPDGNTALIGGFQDAHRGAAWVFVNPNYDRAP
jgi:hypothetical protein